MSWFNKSREPWSVKQIIGDRDEQQDDYSIDSQPDGDAVDSLLLVVADGMGGHKGGAQASQLAARVFVSEFADLAGTVAQRLDQCIDLADAAIAEGVKLDPDGLEGMGSTIAA